jgi:hypothetical protein
LTSALDEAEWSASRLSRFTPGTHWIEGWVGLRSGIDVVEKIKPCPCRDSKPDHPARSPSLYQLSCPGSITIIIIIIIIIIID